jgi:3-hydroxyisobutyrate dehydrogenase
VKSPETIAVLGAGGTMGQAMARNLAGAGYAVHAWNRSREKAEPLSADGITVTDTVAEAAQGATIILTMLADADSVSDTITQVQPATPGADVVWLQMSTIGEAGAERCAELADARSLTLVDAPVSGTKQPAQEGTLVILASGPEAIHGRVDPIFDVVGHKTLWVGEAGAGQRLKLVVNSWLLAVVEGAAESLALAEGLGLDPKLLLETVADGPLDLPYLQMKGQAMIDRSFEPAFALKLAAKDAGLAVDSAARHDLDLPLLTVIRERFDAGALAHGEQDLSATFLTSAPDGAPG